MLSNMRRIHRMGQMGRSSSHSCKMWYLDGVKSDKR